MTSHKGFAYALEARREPDGVMVIRCPEEIRNAFTAIAEAQGVDVDELFLRVFDKALQRRGQRKRSRQ